MLLSKFWRSTSGNFSLVLGLGLPAILTAVAFATDVSTLMRANSNLQNALDAANLASSHLGDLDVTRNDAFDRYFQANIAGHGELGNAKATLTVDKGVNFVKTKAVASADVTLNFAFLFGKEKHIEVDASAVESNNQLEVVLVLDNTGSMAGARMTALRTATKSLLDKLEATKSPTRQIRASLVPFVTAVNVDGDEFDPSWIDMDGKSSTNGVNFPVIDGKRPNHMALFKQLKQTGWTEPGWNNTGWKGCVEARPGAYNISDTPPDPDEPDTLFVPYFAPDDPEVAQKPSASYGKIVLLLTDGENVVYGASEQPTKSDYTSYGYLAGGRFGSDSQATAARNVDGWTKSVCTQLKNEGVQIYTMVLQSDTAANRSLYSACASDPSGYYAVNDPTKLPDVFQQIANKFSKLQLTD